MIITKGKENRCGIFLYYDRQGIVDDYVIYLLNGIRPHLKYLLVVVNGQLEVSSKKKLENVADEVMEKENEGFDVGGYRAGIFHIGLDKLAEYDETILFNYTYFGPLYPFSEMFDKMDDMDLDFWGITRHYKVDPDPYGVNRYGYMPEHIQSHFMVMRSDFIKTEDYRNFITNLKNPTSYIESICEYETVFTKIFEDLGYKWDTYVDSSEYEGYNYCPIMFSIKDMIAKQRCPIIKRRSFFTDYHDFLLNTCGESSVEAYEYIRDNLDYDLKLAWDNLTRLENMTEISKAMQLNYMHPADVRYVDSTKYKTAVFIYVESTKHFERYIDHINAVPDETDLYFIGTCEQSVHCVQRVHNNIQINDSNYLNAYKAVQEKASEYDLVGMLVMADVEIEKPYSNYDSWQYRDFENLLGNRNVIYNIFDTFETNDRLGMLVPPVPYHGSLFEKMDDGWMGMYDEAQRFINETAPGISCKKTEPPQAPFGGSFFARSDALTNVKISTESESGTPAKEIFLMSLIYQVQYAGYYSGVSYNNDYAAIETTNYDYMMRELNKVVFEKYGPNYHKVVVDNIMNDNIIRYPHVASLREKIKVAIVTVLRKIFPQKLYTKLRRRYMKMRGWE